MRDPAVDFPLENARGLSDCLVHSHPTPSSLQLLPQNLRILLDFDLRDAIERLGFLLDFGHLPKPTLRHRAVVGVEISAKAVHAVACPLAHIQVAVAE